MKPTLSVGDLVTKAEQLAEKYRGIVVNASPEATEDFVRETLQVDFWLTKKDRQTISGVVRLSFRLLAVAV